MSGAGTLAVAGAVQTLDGGQLAHQAGQAAGVAVVGIDVLAQQGDLAHALVSEALGLLDDVVDGPRPLAAARIGHHAEGAELVAAFLHGHKGGNATVFDAGLTGIG